MHYFESTVSGHVCCPCTERERERERRGDLECVLIIESSTAG